MANKAFGGITTKILTDLNRAGMSGNLNYEPANDTEKWIYREIIIDSTSTALLQAGIQYEGSIRTDEAEKEIATGDKVKWIVIKHTGTSDGTAATSEGVVISLAASGSAAFNEVEGIFIASGDIWMGKLPATTCNDIGAITVTVANGSPSEAGAADVLVQVAAVIDDVDA